MNASDIRKPIGVKDIDLDDTRFEICAGDGDLSSLALSIQTAGMLLAPVLWPVRESFVIVSGFKRIRALCLNLAADSSGTDQIRCIVLENADEKECAIRAITENAFQRKLTLAETINGLKLLNRYMDSDQIARNSLQIFNCSMNESHIRDLLTLEKTDPRMAGLLNTGQVCLKAGLQICRYAPPLPGLFLDLFSRIKASASKQMELISWSVEIMAREKLSPLGFFHEKQIQDILNLDTRDQGYKGDLVRQYLAKRRYPCLEKKRNQVKQTIRKLNLGKGIQFAIPENFEGTTYSLSIDFKTPAELEKKLADLASLGKNPLLARILDRELI